MKQDESDFAALTSIFDKGPATSVSSKLEFRRFMSELVELAKEATRVAKYVTLDPADTDKCLKAHEALRDFSGDLSKFARIRSELAKRWRSELFEQDLRGIYERFTGRYMYLTDPYDPEFRRDARYLRSFAKQYVNVADMNSFVSDLRAISEVSACERMLAEKKDVYIELFGSVFNGMDTDLDILRLTVNYAYKLNRLFEGNVPESIRNMHSNGVAASLVERFVTGRRELCSTTDQLAEYLSEIAFNSMSAGGATASDMLISYAGRMSDICARYTQVFDACAARSGVTPDDAVACAYGMLSIKDIASADIQGKDELISLFGSDCCAENTDWNFIVTALGSARELVSNDDNAPCIEIIKNAGSAAELKEICEAVSTACTDVSATVKTAVNMFRNPEELMSIKATELLARLNACLGSFVTLRALIDYKASKNEMAANGLGQFAEAAERENCDDGIVKAFKVEIYKLWLDGHLKHHGITSIPDRVRHNAINEEFESLDTAQFDIARRSIRKKIVDNVPSVTNPTHEMRLLLEEVNNSRHSLSIRKLLKHTVDVLPYLKPCMMMSPQSVSFYLESAGSDKSYKFDMVVFDEASQVLPEHAISAIIRADQAIIVGDTKQMPPSQLFMLGASESEEQSSVTIGEGGAVTVVKKEEPQSREEESALDLAIKASSKKDDDSFLIGSDNSASILEETKNALDSYSLIWHYRSRYEELISFSNDNWYHSLVTFPEAVTGRPDTGVEYIRVTDGVYRGGSGSRNNPREAVECVKQIIRYINLYPERSLGVITMNVAQAELIENLLLKFRAANTEYEPFFSEDRYEPFFIKSVENIQGDERDTIIFSITYGKDENGKFRKNFGSLSVEGGERRLNVAVTRSKGNFKVVTSLIPEDFGALESLTSEGTRILCEYIRYARSIGTRPMAQGFEEIDGAIVYAPSDSAESAERKFTVTAAQTEDGEADSENALTTPKSATDSVVRRVGEFLEAQGYKVKYSVGSSSKYTVDIAVCDPADEEKYIAGIECDGYVYGRSRTARDRDRLKRQVLRRMGWKMYRVWSTDWIMDNETEKNELVKFLASCSQSV